MYSYGVDFSSGLSGDEFKFTSTLDGPIRYKILHFKQTTAGQYSWIHVGSYEYGVLQLNLSVVAVSFTIQPSSGQIEVLDPGLDRSMVAYLAHFKPPLSVCSLPCSFGQAKKYMEGEKCCWHCFNCTQYEILISETECFECKYGFLPDAEKRTCVPIPEKYIDLNSAMIIGK